MVPFGPNLLPLVAKREELCYNRQHMDIKLKEQPSTKPPSGAPVPILEPQALPPAIPPPAGRALVDLAKYEDIARRLIMGETQAEIAQDINYSERHLRRMLHRPDFVEVYQKVSASFYKDMDKVMLNEKLRPIHRAQAMEVRSLTLLANIQAEVQRKIDQGDARSTDLKVGSDTAFGIIDRSKGELSPAGTTQIVNHFILKADKKKLLREVVEEAGVDISDLGIIIDVEPESPDNPPEETPDGRQSED